MDKFEMKVSPETGESRDDFMKRCVPVVMEDGTAEDGDQATAVCSSMWGNRKIARMGSMVRAADGKTCVKDDEVLSLELSCMGSPGEALARISGMGYKGAKKAIYNEDDGTFIVKFVDEIDKLPQRSAVMLDDNVKAIIGKTPEERSDTTMKESALLERPRIGRFHVQTAYEEKGATLVIEGFASTANVDRDGDIVSPNAFKSSLKEYLENPLLCYMHDWKAPIGLVTDARIVNKGEKMIFNGKDISTEGGGLYIRGEVVTTNAETRQLIKQRVLRAFSIGFMVKEDEWDDEKGMRTITDLELFEVSVVSVPSNRTSMFSLSKAAKYGTDLIDDEGIATMTKDTGAPDDVRKRIIQAQKEGKLIYKDRKPEEVIEDVIKMFGENTVVSSSDGSTGPSLSSLSIEGEKELKPYETVVKEGMSNVEKKGQGFDAMVSRFLASDFDRQRVLTMSFPAYKTAMVSKAINEIADGKDEKTWNVTKISNLSYSGDRARPVYSMCETARGKSEELLIEGLRWLKKADGNKKMVAYAYEGYCTYNVQLYYNVGDANEAGEFEYEIRNWIHENNFYKGEKITPFGRFLPIPDVKFEDVKMSDEQRTSIKLGTIDFFDKRDFYAKNKLSFKRGMIFAGYPGTGKTMSGKAIAAHTDKTFIWANASEFRGIGHLFAMARELAPSIIFAEDIDDFLQYSSGVDVLKTEMDGLNAEDGLVTILCTNFPENIPDALIDRPSRFDDVIKFEMPDRDTRLDILVSHSKNIEIEDRDTLLGDVADKTEGMTGAHLKEIVIFAMLLAFDAGSESVTQKEMERALKKVQKTRDMVSGMREKGFKAPGIGSLTFKSVKGDGKKETLQFTGTSGNVEGEYEEGQHTHEFALSVERNDDGVITMISGIANSSDAMHHEHPISQLGRTDTVENHYHMFTVDTDMGAEDGDGDTGDPESGAVELSVTIPRKMLADIFEELVNESPDLKKLEEHLIYLQSIVGKRGTDENRVKQLVELLKQAKELAENYLS